MNHDPPLIRINALDRRQWVFLLLLLAVFFIVQYVPLADLRFEDVSTGFGTLEEPTSLDEMSHSISGGDQKRQAALGLLGLFGFLTLFDRKALPLRINGALGWLILFYLGWIYLTLPWAQDLALTIRRVVIFAIFCLSVVAIVRRFSIEDVIRFTFFSTFIYLLAGIAVEIIRGRFHPLSAVYRFAGAFHPNGQGMNCALLLLSAVFLAGKVKQGTLWYHGAALTAFIFLFLTKSRTSLGSVICALLLYWFMVLSSSRKLMLALVAGWFGSLILLLFSDTILSRYLKIITLGRDTADMYSLTGRIPLWEECLRYVAESPILGYGYQSFWTPEHLNAISYRIGWPPYASHSVYIDLLLGVGIIGLLAYLAIYCSAMGRAYRCFSDSGNAGYAFIAALLCFCLLDGFLETTPLTPNQLSFVSMAALASLAFSPTLAGELPLQE